MGADNADPIPNPFAEFAGPAPPRTKLRDAITSLHRAPEADCVAALLPEARLPEPLAAAAQSTARRLIEALRAKGTAGLVQGLVHEYQLSSQEGIALMCLAEALLRIPDTATRDALIRDKIGGGNWAAHLHHGGPLFVNAATWGLVVTGRLVAPVDAAGLTAALGRLVARAGEPVIRRAVDLAMRMMGEQFVKGQSIEEALANSRREEGRGYRYSYDMLGEAAATAADAERYLHAYRHAIGCIGQHAGGRGAYDGPGISVKLSALHPRYSRAQRARVMDELLPRLAHLAALAHTHDIGLNIDAEEADRLDLSLDLLAALCDDPTLAGWNGIGFVVQAYQKRAPAVIDWLIDLARRSGHRLMVRLVKGAYWDSEIKRAQQEGLADFPVFTRKPHTDVCYLACARRLLAAVDAVFPQFATHNAHTAAAIYHMAGPDFRLGSYEFQCLHGMGEPLYDEVLGLDRPVRIYAPVGTHDTLLAYLVRRLLENGANSSFVSRLQDPAVAVEELAADPVAQVAATDPPGAPHPAIRAPRALFAPGRLNSVGLDLASDAILAGLAGPLANSARVHPLAAPDIAIRNPADRRDLVGEMAPAKPEQIEAALAHATTAAPAWAARPPAERGTILLRAADALEAAMPTLLGPIIREAGKTLAAAMGEVREAVDFLRYYATQITRDFANASHLPLGVVLCVSPWNFPLSIFTGQLAAALAAGNAALAKPAEETPLIAARAVALLHAAGVPEAALQLVPGDGAVGAQLVADARVHGVMFTGSTEVARLIQRSLAQRLNPDGAPVPLVAETAGQNAMIVDSSALAEQVVADVLASAFDSAGQRCSALRLLCLQEEVAGRILDLLKGALAELAVGNPALLSTDIGPVISDDARNAIQSHITRLRSAGCPVHQSPLPESCRHGSFVAPAIIEIPDLAMLDREVFGPVLHVLRFRRDAMASLIARINATGYALTFGVHTRIGDVAELATSHAAAGNIYVNRNMIGAVVGVQPFGGHALSGTGPKAGGPLYLLRLLARYPATTAPLGALPSAFLAFRNWLARNGLHPAWLPEATPLGVDRLLPGPTGEENRYQTEPRGTVLCLADTEPTRLAAIAVALATGNRVLLPPGSRPATLPDWIAEGSIDGADAVLFAGPPDRLRSLLAELAAREGPIVPVLVAAPDGSYPLAFLVRERAISTNTSAAGGDARLMTLGV